ncbi:IPTL-CTERM sorting domain-containing protein [Thiohalocapsa marina]|uniref:IPTL-CTERM sorting domain-containing protein n=2 Tax=Thiohalocapsa marina TaxID=424902 RepID=A0A5M8FQU1_9GAMM|nr:IPTL-CTERM sorting domain-containing protein [Thiohalocapsa marina]KAA6184945.1 IPTL-CTERM sorting domain-containing protein [Thiohalocapsa marina]
MSALACAIDGTLYGVSHDTDKFYTINKTNGTATEVGDLTIPVASQTGLGYIGSKLYLVADWFAGSNSPTMLYEINIVTGAASFVANLDGGALHLENLASPEEAAGSPVAIPTLSQWALMLLIGAMSLISMRQLKGRSL